MRTREKTFVRWMTLAIALITVGGCGAGETTQPPSNTATPVAPPAVDADLQACKKKMDATLFRMVGDSAGPWDVLVTFATHGVMPTDDGRSEEVKTGPSWLPHTHRDQLRELCNSDNVQFISYSSEVPNRPLGHEHP